MISNKKRIAILKSLTSGKLNANSFILATLADAGSILVESFFPKHYSFTYLGRKILGLNKNQAPWSKNTLIKNIHRLKSVGLVAKEKNNYCLSEEGRKLMKLAENYGDSLIQKWDGRFRMIIFDIPEKKKKSREWLRRELNILNFKPLQRSVFVGKNPLPESFIQNINDSNLDEFIHIFTIDQSSNPRSIEKLFR